MNADVAFINYFSQYPFMHILTLIAITTTIFAAILKKRKPESILIRLLWWTTFPALCFTLVINVIALVKLNEYL